MSQLDEFEFFASSEKTTVTGMASTRWIGARVREAVQRAVPDSITPSIEIAIGPKRLAVSSVRARIAELADCGPLVLEDAPETSYALRDEIKVTGFYAEAGTKTDVQGALVQLAGDRKVIAAGEVLNESLCEIYPLLQGLQEANFGLEFSFGKDGRANENRQYRVGDNPVIDLLFPRRADEGFLWVSLIDGKGDVFHLLPNDRQMKYAVPQLKELLSGRKLRLAHTEDAARNRGELGFLVDDEFLGKSAVVVFYTNDALFKEIRPFQESVESFAEALSQALRVVPRDEVYGGVFPFTTSR